MEETKEEDMELDQLETQGTESESLKREKGVAQVFAAAQAGEKD